MPVDPGLLPILPSAFVTLPPPMTSIAPVPEFPTTSSPGLVHVEFAPATVTAPFEPTAKPMTPIVFETAPPF